MYYILTTALCFSLASMVINACDPDYTEQDIKSKYCKSEVVFKGVPTGGASTFSTDENDVVTTHQKMIFSVTEYYKTNNYHATKTEEVERDHQESDDCSEGFFPEEDDSYLILATEDLFLKVPTCGYVVPMKCVKFDLNNVSC